MKSDAPSDVRGEFAEIPTAVPGIRICEHLPRLAKTTDKTVIIRSLVGAKDRHESHQCRGEFGRTPRVNKDGGRDHWPNVSCALLAGGGMPCGQVIGATDRLGGEPADRPVHFQEVFASLYRNLGIDPNATTVSDLNGRPRYLVDDN